MKYLKNIGISFFYIIIILLILTFIITILNYFNLINSHIMAILQIITLIISLFIGGVIIGKKSAKKGWLEGLYLGIIFLFILLPLHYLILNHSFEIKNLIFYLIIIITTMFGSMLGINKNSIKQ